MMTHSLPRALILVALSVVVSAWSPAPPPPIVFTSIGAGSNFSCGLATDSKVYCWGFGFTGALGDAMSTQSAVPVRVAGNNDFASLSVGFVHSCALTTTGAAFCWGSNASGQIGDGTTIHRNAPTAVSGGLTFTSISAGGSHTCGIATDGKTYCWGANASGGLGNGTTTNSSVPVQVSGGLTFTAVSAGNLHSCALVASGAAHCWGDNSTGRLGNNTTTNSSTPVAVTGGLTFTKIVTGNFHTCGIRTGGLASCWGSNNNGRLGNGTTTQSNVPVSVSGGLTFASISIGAHSCAVQANGAAHCWGRNVEGGLGNGSNTESTTPVAVVGGLAFSVVSAGNSHSCGITTGGTAYCWGNGNALALGTGSPANVNVPTIVLTDATPIVVSLSPDSISGMRGETYEVQLRAEMGGTALGSYTGTIDWDSTVIRLDSVRPGQFAGAPTVNGVNAGSMRITAADPNGTSGTISLAKLYFRVVNDNVGARTPILPFFTELNAANFAILRGSMAVRSGVARVVAHSVAANFSPDSAGAPVDGRLSVMLTADLSGSPGVALGSYSATVSWDSTVARLDSVETADFGSPATNQPDAASLRLTAASAAGRGGAAFGLAKLHFRLVGPTAPAVTSLSATFDEMTAAGTFARLNPGLVANAGKLAIVGVLRGDVDLNGVVAALDAQAILLHLVGLPLPAGFRPLTNGDANCNTRTEALDAQIVLGHVVGNNVSAFCVGAIR